MPDADGYPTAEELEKVKAWDAMAAPWGLVQYLKAIWWAPDWGFYIYRSKDWLHKKPVWKLTLHTGGWSGNEDIISTLKGTMFWQLYWQGSRRGGHYWFQLPPKRKHHGS